MSHARLAALTVADAWTKTRLGNPAALDAIRDQVPLRYRAAHQDGDAIVLVVEGRHGGCVDLISRPNANAVETRRC